MQLFSAPTAINLELTDACNVRCRHCYNFWRAEDSSNISLTPEKLDRLVEMFAEASIFHVVLTGGEPFARFDLLKRGIRKLIDSNISISCNSNLMLATDDKLKQLADFGVDHILTSLNSYDPKTNDYIVNNSGAFSKIVDGIERAIKNGIRISVNMIVSQLNKEHVYRTGKLAHELGCQKIFGTRVVPSVKDTNPAESDFHLTKEDALCTLDQLVQVKQETGIMIGTLVSYPLCLLSDLERYKDFVGRGCPGQSGHILSINASGETHACVHQEEGYGNVFDNGIRETYRRMNSWHDGSYHHHACQGCDYLSICASGCRMSAHGYYGSMNGPDNLMVNRSNFIKPFHIVHDKSIYDKIDHGLKFIAPKRLRFRKETGFYLVNIRWANTISCHDDIAVFLLKYRASGEEFTLQQFGIENRDLLAQLYFKDAIECPSLEHEDRRHMAGLSANVN